MDAKTYWKKYGDEHVEQVCKAAKTTLSNYKVCMYSSSNSTKNKFGLKLCHALVRETGGELTLEELRPDVFDVGEAA